ncbi:MAG: NAD(P)(+) transhydrogenase (Re/Si-specific) subunit beta [Ruminococcus sp.]|uniref:NAD(P)(+) transhydrogenase (Re/Si-specific) subunit beta n=1 Tax=Ruminococcus sp. TaxID=41978 RepID=UPI0025CC6B0F|nr:NAD(P)(+) transhydrogenase (Re/Si-specific) subunit beta [Ruminococcus sp.]MCR5542338.1 NAD(P)(+) transhydrogenase (Re/Si-specific) subunit beta [Ruminococcus sp.]
MNFENIRTVCTTVLYMVSSVLFIRGIKLLGKADTARKGNLMSSVGMLIAVVTVLFEKQVTDTLTSGPMGNAYIWGVAAIALGSIIGAIWAKKVEMTGMPQLVALFNGFGGLSSLLVALTQYMTDKSINTFSAIALGLTVAIGAIAFTGSVVAWGKLSGKMFKKNVTIPAKNAINGLLAAVGLVGVVIYALSIAEVLDASVGTIGIIIVTAAYLILGFTMVVAIGGGDMPVIISLLNAFSGLAAAFAGLSISNSVLVVSGCLVGTSGLILTLIMCKAMNRTLYALLFSSFGATKKGAAGEQKEPKSMSVEDAYLILEAASSVVFIPGYGMAVAQAQHAVKELCDKLEANGAEVNFAIHPVAGRMPGHMNVLLAEANVPYEQLKTADEMNPQMSNTDVAIVIGANDVVNPSAINDESSPLYGMPIINAFEARTVFVLKRGKGTGFSGVENPLFTNDNTVMIYGDAKNTVAQLVSEFEE